MEKDFFGSITYDGKMINLDKEKVDKLEEISVALKEKCSELREKANSMFND